MAETLDKFSASDFDTGDVLDKLAGVDPAAPPTDEPEIVTPEAPADPKPADPADPAPADPPADPKPADPVPVVEPKASDPAPADPKPADPAPADPASDPYPQFKLGPHSKPQTTEQFTKLKMAAAQDLAAKDVTIKTHATKIESLLQKVAELEAKPTLGEDVKAELNTLRAFKESIALEGDPVFTNKYETPIQSVDSAIFQKLKDSGLSDENIARIKEIGATGLDWEPVFKAVPNAKAFIERKLMERDGLVEKKQEAIRSARTNYETAVAERRESATVKEKQDTDATVKEYENFLSTTAMLKVQSIPVDATAEQKAEILAANAVIQDALKTGRRLVADTGTPEGRAEAATVAAMAHIFKARARGAEAQLQRTLVDKTTLEGELTKTKDELTKTKDELTKLRRAGRIVPPGGDTRGGGGAIVKGPGLLASSDEALDHYARTVE